MNVCLDVDRRFFALDEEFACSADAEAQVRGFGGAADFNGILVDDVLVSLGIALLVVDIPAQGFEERVNELGADLGLIIFAGLVSLALRVKPLNQLQYFLWNRHVLTCEPL